MRLLICFLLGLSGTLTAQPAAGARNGDRAILLNFGYGPFRSAGDLADRFGGGFALDGGVDYAPPSGPWQVGLMVAFGFGNSVKEDVLAGLRTDAGFLIGNQRQPAEVALRQRQLFVGPRFGYTLPLGKNARAGLKSSTAVGYFYSRIRLQADPVQFVPQIDGRRAAGYDRLAGGPALYQFLGYQQLALDRRLNFYLGADLTAGFTRALRAFDVATGGPSPEAGRRDIVLGVRAGIILPLYLGTGEAIYY